MALGDFAPYEFCDYVLNHANHWKPHDLLKAYPQEICDLIMKGVDGNAQLMQADIEINNLKEQIRSLQSTICELEPKIEKLQNENGLLKKKLKNAGIS